MSLEKLLINLKLGKMKCHSDNEEQLLLPKDPNMSTGCNQSGIRCHGP